MKKFLLLISALLSFPGCLFAQSYPSPIFNNTTINGTLSGAGVVTLLAPYAPVASPNFTGTVTSPSGANLNPPATLTLTNATGLPAGSLTGLGTGVGTALTSNA